MKNIYWAVLCCVALSIPAAAADTVKKTDSVKKPNFKKFESCYDTWGQAEETNEGGKNITRFKSEEELWDDCTQTILRQA